MPADHEERAMASVVTALPCRTIAAANRYVPLRHTIDFGRDNPARWGVASDHQRDIVSSRFVAWRIPASADKAVYRRNQAIPKT